MGLVGVFLGRVIHGWPLLLRPLCSREQNQGQATISRWLADDCVRPHGNAGLPGG